VGTFPTGSRPGADLRSRRKCVSYQEKHRERENNNRKRNVCTERGMGRRTRDNAKRETGQEKGDALICDIRGGELATWEEMIKRDVRSGDCSLSPRIVRRLSLLFTFPVPRSPFSELHAPNPTSDPHKGRRGRDTFGKSSSTPLQRTRRVSQKSLIPRYVCFSDSLGSGGAQAE